MDLDIISTSASVDLDTALPQYVEPLRQLDSFIASCESRNLAVVMVTSGGTTVPLESRTVRFIDNFSSGKRGSSSAEYFLSKGYAVIFLHRATSLRPFDRHFNRLSPLDICDASMEQLTIKEEFRKLCKEHAAKKASYIDSNLLHLCEFTSVYDYLLLLKGCCQYLKSIGPKALLYLAAAVSDFYIPLNELPEHKIQSSDGPMNLRLRQVPKMLRPLVQVWVPEAYVISFKLETDIEILVSKAQRALTMYQHNLVIGNILETRNEVCECHNFELLSFNLKLWLTCFLQFSLI